LPETKPPHDIIYAESLREREKGRESERVRHESRGAIYNPVREREEKTEKERRKREGGNKPRREGHAEMCVERQIAG